MDAPPQALACHPAVGHARRSAAHSTGRRRHHRPLELPVNLVILPASAALAAGNRVMIKISEVTPPTAHLLKSLAPRYFDPDELTVVTGDVEVATQFAEQTFDHLFFTGSPAAGCLVQQAAGRNLVPVTLELGGKNPVVLSPRANVTAAAARIARAKMINGGQVCVSPDYVFVPKDEIDAFADTARNTLRGMFPTIVANADYCSSVNDANFDRVVGLLDDARAKGTTVEAIAPQSESLPHRGTRKIPPTIVRGVDDRMQIAEQEIFGPVLVVKDYTELDDVINYVNQRPAPLVSYWYGPDDADFQRFVSQTRSGGVARNDFAAQMIPSDAPFGGVGRSGMGVYHGKAGFDTFSITEPWSARICPSVSVTAPRRHTARRCVWQPQCRYGSPAVGYTAVLNALSDHDPETTSVSLAQP